MANKEVTPQKNPNQARGPGSDVPAKTKDANETYLSEILDDEGHRDHINKGKVPPKKPVDSQ